MCVFDQTQCRYPAVEMQNRRNTHPIVHSIKTRPRRNHSYSRGLAMNESLTSVRPSERLEQCHDPGIDAFSSIVVDKACRTSRAVCYDEN